MNKNRQNKLTHYLSLVAILAVGTLLFYYFTGFPEKQFLIVMLISVSYFIWGVVYHYLEGDLHPKIVVEYLVISLLAIILLKGAILK